MERIEAAKKLSQIPGQEDKQAAAWASIVVHPYKTLMPHTGDRIRAAEIVSKIPGHEAKAAELLEIIINRSSYARVFRIKAAIQLSKIPGYEAKAATYLLERIEDPVCTEDDSSNRKKAAKCLSEMAKQGNEVIIAMAKRARSSISKNPRYLTENRYYLGKQLLEMDEEDGAVCLLNYAQDNESPGDTIGNRMHAAMRLLKMKGQEEKAAAALSSIAQHPARWVQNRFSAAEKLSTIPGQEEMIAATWESIAQDATAVAVSDQVRYNYRIRAAERLAGVLGQNNKLRATEVLKSISGNKQVPLSSRTEAAEVLSRITQGTELVDFLFTVVQDVTVLFFDRVEAAERLAKLVDEDEQGKAWTLLLNERHSYLDGDTGIKIAKKLSKIKKYEAIAADYFIYIGRYPCLFSDSVFTYRFIKACKHLAKIPGYEGIAAELLIKKSDLIVKRLEKSKCSGTTSDELLDLYRVAKALQEIPGQEENTARIWLTIMQYDTNQRNLGYIAQYLLRIPGHEEKAKTVWLYLQSIEEKFKKPALKTIHEIMSARGLFEAGETEKAAEILSTCAENEKQSIDRRMLAVQNLEKIPGQENKAKELGEKLNADQKARKSQILAAKNRLQIPEEKEQGANDLLSIAKNTAVAFSDRILAAEALCELPEQHPKAIEALQFIAGHYEDSKFVCGDSTLYQYHWLQAAEKLSKIPGQEENARKIVDSYVFKISDESRYFKW